MNEPPILPGNGDRLPEGNLGSDHTTQPNPFGPTLVEPLESSIPSTIDLPAKYWVALAIAFLVFLGLCFIVPGFGVPGVLALIAAAIRVPLVQRRQAINLAHLPSPQPLALLLTSWIFSLVFGVTSCIAFCIICIPSGFLVLAVSPNSFQGGGNGGENLIPIVLGISGFIALACYVMLFIWSLKWRA